MVKISGSSVVVLVLVLVLVFSSLSFSSAGFFDYFRKITGKATDAPISMNVTIGNNNPYLIFIDVNASNQAADEQGILNVLAEIHARDQDGSNNLNDSTLLVNFSKTGEATRIASCTKQTDIDVKTANYTCVAQLWYFDLNGEWNLSVSLSDKAHAGVRNQSTPFVFAYSKSFKIAPTNLTWGTIAAGDTNKQPLNTPLQLNNTGNAVISPGNILVNSSDLQGESDPSMAIYANNFSINYDGSNACSGTILTRKVNTGIAIANLTRGNLSRNDGTAQEQIYPCIKLAGNELSAQQYSTLTDGPWRVSI